MISTLQLRESYVPVLSKIIQRYALVFQRYIPFCPRCGIPGSSTVADRMFQDLQKPNEPKFGRLDIASRSFLIHNPNQWHLCDYLSLDEDTFFEIRDEVDNVISTEDYADFIKDPTKICDNPNNERCWRLVDTVLQNLSSKISSLSASNNKLKDKNLLEASVFRLAAQRRLEARRILKGSKKVRSSGFGAHGIPNSRRSGKEMGVDDLANPVSDGSIGFEQCIIFVHHKGRYSPWFAALATYAKEESTKPLLITDFDFKRLMTDMKNSVLFDQHLQELVYESRVCPVNKIEGLENIQPLIMIHAKRGVDQIRFTILDISKIATTAKIAISRDNVNQKVVVEPLSSIVVRSYADLTTEDLNHLQPILLTLYQMISPDEEPNKAWISKFFDGAFKGWDSSVMPEEPILPKRVLADTTAEAGTVSQDQPLGPRYHRQNDVKIRLTVSLTKVAGLVEFKFLDAASKRVNVDTIKFDRPINEILARALINFDECERNRYNTFNLSKAVWLVRNRLHYWLHVASRYDRVPLQPEFVLSEPNTMAVTSLREILNEVDHLTSHVSGGQDLEL
jgi:hypothetical protein